MKSISLLAIRRLSGKKEQSSEQKKELKDTFGGRNVGNLDYVGGWFKKAADYIGSGSAKAAFVATNSISQGEQPALLWPPIFDAGLKIAFARRTFTWSSQADDEAHVHVVVISIANRPSNVRLYDGSSVKNAAEINPYLFPGTSSAVNSRSCPLSQVPAMSYGSMPIDNGCLILSKDEADEIVDSDPELTSVVRKYLGGKEFLSGAERYCLWFKDIDPTVALKSPFIMERIEKCKAFRESSNRPQTRAAAVTPYLFGEIRQPDSSALVFPKVSSGTRRYIPIGFVPPETIISGSALMIPCATIFHFGVLSSTFHNAWMRVVAGRMKSDYQYSANIVYNNFVWPEANGRAVADIERAAKAVLDVRERHSDLSLAKLYDMRSAPLLPDLYDAHADLDRAVEMAYGVDFGGNEDQIVSHLFQLYSEKVSE